MQALFHRLMNGSERTLRDLVEAADFWRRFHEENGTIEQAFLATAVWSSYNEYMPKVGFDHASKWSMPFVAIGTLHDEITGFNDRIHYAIRIAKAFIAGNLPSEVSTATAEAILLYSLHNRDDDLKSFACRELGLRK